MGHGGDGADDNRRKKSAHHGGGTDGAQHAAAFAFGRLSGDVGLSGGAGGDGSGALDDASEQEQPVERRGHREDDADDGECAATVEERVQADAVD